MQKDLRLTVDIATMANANDMNYMLLTINFINYAIVTITQTITTFLISFQGLTLEGRGG